jgi:hypothetical protein
LISAKGRCQGSWRAPDARAVRATWRSSPAGLGDRRILRARVAAGGASVVVAELHEEAAAATLVCFLLADPASFVNGAGYHLVDGAYTAG